MSQASDPLLPCVELVPGGEPRASVIWLHGLGADGHDFVPIVPQLGLPSEHGVRFVFPHAPQIPVTINGGLVMPAWFDIRTLDEHDQDEEGVRRSDQQIVALLEREKNLGVSPEHTVLAGFSQGGTMALFSGLRYPETLAGIMALSSFLMLPGKLYDEVHPSNSATSIFQAHGTLDPAVPYSYGVRSRDSLLENGYAVEWHDYPMAHQVCLEEVTAIGQWLRTALEID